mmetsp:Transcript_34626/g.35315  ORF Transcript_34626/g.35315 Transcript_34626/m.35315 type:complete len:127 (+) Transcript_34626:83-463(+)
MNSEVLSFSMKHSRTEFCDDENRISNSIKRLRIDSGNECKFPERPPVSKLFPPVDENDEVLGDVDYCMVSPILKELAMLRNLRKLQRHYTKASGRETTYGINIGVILPVDESVAMDQDEFGESYTP